MQSYDEFLRSKAITFQGQGIQVRDSDINPMLFEFQRDLTRWALRKGTAAIFADTGLGKSWMQLEWARLTGERVLIIAPLTVARQTVNEAHKIGLDIHYTRTGGDLRPGINITNYEIIDHFDPTDFGAVVLDESSILKGLDGKTRQLLTEMFSGTPYKLCCTATPAPNDIAEIANHAEFLGIMRRVDMLATFFVHDDEGWRLRGHGQEKFFRWLASWGMSVRKPSDLGYSDKGYDLPPLKVSPLWVDTDYVPEGQLFWTGDLSGIKDRIKVRRSTQTEKAQAIADLVNGNDEQWIIWHGLNGEGYAVQDLVPDAVLVEGNQDMETKQAAIEAFQDGRIRVLLTKPKIAGFGLNLQNCHNMAFLGLSDSWEAYYQCIRRCYRFGQTQPVNAYIVLSTPEEPIYTNVMSKEKEAKNMSQKLIENVQEFEREEIGNLREAEFTYETAKCAGESYVMMLGDSAERMTEISDESVDLSVFSPPFMALFTYSATERDLGNSRNASEFFEHFGFIIGHLLRVTKPGRNCAVHIAQVTATLNGDGYIGMKDLRGQTIQAFTDRGWIYHGEVCIDKDPQAQAIRTHSKGLLFVQLRKDSSWLRPALADYILVFRKPGDNAVPIHPDLTNNEWIEWARPIWYGIRETDTLNTAVAKENDDDRHICPLQLGTIERVIRLWSNPGEVVLSPFAGIGSEGYEAIRLDRRFIGIELKRNYFDVAVRNLERAYLETHQPTLFDMVAE